MPILFEVHDAERFAGEIRPALAESWRRRSFEPCRPLCAALLPAVRESCGSDWEGQVVARVLAGLRFAPEFWRGLVDEVLLFAAVEVPVVPDALEALSKLGNSHAAVIEQAYRGLHELVIGPVYFRPLAVGVNLARDATRLAQALAGIDPATWNPAEVDADELEYARQGLETLRAMYARAADLGRLVVCEAW